MAERKRYTWADRLENYAWETGYPNALFFADDGRVVGTWILGNSYIVRSGYYGGYPNTYLPRVRALFRDKKKALHLFAGKVDLDLFPGDTVDLDKANDPTFVDDAQTLLNVPLEDYDLVLCDPPYSIEDAYHYMPSMVRRTRVMRALKRLPKDAHIVWLDQVLPQWTKEDFSLEAVIGIVRSTNHRFRVLSVFRRL